MFVLKLMNEHGKEAFNILETKYKIKLKSEIDEDGSELMALNYDQIDSPKFDQIVRECRGLIIDPNTLTIVSRSFDRFFNYGEGGDNDNFKLSRSVIAEKVDGSLMKLYYHNGKWRVSTRGTCFANCPVGAFDITFKDLFWRAALKENTQEAKDEFLKCLHTNLTYIFEVATPENRVVTRYDGDQFVLLGARCPISGYYKQIPYLTNICERASGISNIRLPKMFKMDSFDQLLAATREMGGLQEGFVAWDTISDERIKFKSPAYVAVHHIRGNGALVPKRIAQLVLINEHEEYLTYFEEDRRFFEPFVEAYNIMMSDMSAYYHTIKNIEEQKKFALLATKQPYSSILFTARAKNISVVEAFANAKEQTKLKLLMGMEEFIREN